MKTSRTLFGLMMILNIVLTLWLLRQRKTIQAFTEASQESQKFLQRINRDLDEANERLYKVGDELNIQNLRTIASNDQIEAFLEEHSRYGQSDT